MSRIVTHLVTWLSGELVGTDVAGNRYYRERRRRRLIKGGGRESRERRWVLFEGADEPSKVPPEWHGWLHHTVALPPTERALVRHPWQLPHLPNLTGTAAAYRPAGSVARGAHRARASGDYEPWTP